MENKLPVGYKEGIERVSNIVSFMFPFGGDEKQRYLDWLNDDVLENRKRGFPIKEEEYLLEAQKVGTFIHQQMEWYIENTTKQATLNPLYERHINVIKHGLEYYNNLIEKYKCER